MEEKIIKNDINEKNILLTDVLIGDIERLQNTSLEKLHSLVNTEVRFFNKTSKSNDEWNNLINFICGSIREIKYYELQKIKGRLKYKQK